MSRTADMVLNSLLRHCWENNMQVWYKWQACDMVACSHTMDVSGWTMSVSTSPSGSVQSSSMHFDRLFKFSAHFINLYRRTDYTALFLTNFLFLFVLLKQQVTIFMLNVMFGFIVKTSFLSLNWLPILNKNKRSCKFVTFICQF